MLLHESIQTREKIYFNYKITYKSKRNNFIHYNQRNTYNDIVRRLNWFSKINMQ